MSEDVKNPMPSDPKEILALAKEKGVELTDEQLEAIAGGNWDVKGSATCPACGVEVEYELGSEFVICPVCGFKIKLMMPY